MINIFSDASCRNFGNIKGIDSYFVGNSLNYNLSSKDSCDLILESINKVDCSMGDNYLHFGEYDIRLSLGFGSLPHLNRNLRHVIDKRKLNFILENYYYLIENLPNNFKIISPLTSFQLMVMPIQYFSEKLILKYGDRFIDLFSEIVQYKLRKTTMDVRSNFKYKQYAHNPYLCDNESISTILCNRLEMAYVYEQKGNMSFGTIFIE